MKNIWQELKKPIMILAPMDDVTDTVFRRIVQSVGRPDLFFTEFASVDGIQSVGNKTVMRKLQFTQEERPLIAQVWGSNPENYYKTAQMLVQMGFDGIDINTGCPDRGVMKKGCCAALIDNRPLAKEIIAAVKEGVRDAPKSFSPSSSPSPSREKEYQQSPRPLGERGGFSTLRLRLEEVRGELPVSVKTRIGTRTIVTEDWLGFLLDQDIDALTVHGRTAKEMSKVPAHWDEIGEAVILRDEMKKDTVIIGNGDVKSLEEAIYKAEKYHLDGIMIGRGIFENLWVFNSKVNPDELSVRARFQKLNEHMQLYRDTWSGQKHFQILKKFVKVYVKGFDGASDIRIHITEAKSYDEMESIIKGYL